MTPTAPIPTSIATACAAHDRHRLDVLDALLDEAAPSAVRELLGAALDLCASLRADRDALAAKLDAAPKVCAIHSYEHGPGPCMTCGAWPPGTREMIAACRTRIAGLERAADERSKEVARVDALFEEARGALVDVATALNVVVGVASPDVASRCRAEVARLTARVAELEARPVLTVERFTEAYIKAKHGDHMWPDDEAARAGLMAAFRSTFARLGPVTLPAQDVAARLTKAYSLEAAAVTGNRIDNTAAMERALASLGAPPTSPPAARPVFAWVSEEELDAAFEAAYRAESVKSASGGKDPRRAAIRAVLARLEVSLVAEADPEAVALRLRDHAREIGLHPQREPADYLDSLARLVRVIFRAAGVPVTPERGK